MPSVQNQVSVAAADVNDNVLSGSQFEFAPYNAMVQFALVGDANAADLRCDVYTGQDVIAENLEPSAQNRVPILPDDVTVEDIVRAGERIKIRVRNTHASTARSLFYRLNIVPV